MGEDDSRIDKLRDQLYSRDYKQKEAKRSGITPKKMEDVKRSWKNPEEPSGNTETKKTRPEGFYVKWLLIISVLFFVVSFAIAALVFIRGSEVSTEKVDVRILGPVSIAGGEELSLEVIVDNKNNVDVESARVQLEYPEGTRTLDNLEEEFSRDQKDYGPIGSGQNARETFNAVLFGQQDSVKEINVKVDYRVQGSSATFTKEKKYEVEISSAPILVNIDFPNEIRSNQEVEFIVDVTSNSSGDLNDVLLNVDYPHGFSFSGSDPEPSFESQDTFYIGKIEPEEKKVVKIRGTLQAQDNEERTFRFNIGTQSTSNQKDLGAVYVSSANTIAIARPSLGLTLTTNGSASSEVVASSGQDISNVISWINNLDQRIVDAEVSATVSGSMLDRNSIVAGSGGFFRSTDDTFVWDQNSQSKLVNISPGDKNNVNFGFNVKPLDSSLGSSMRNPEITINALIEGTRFSEGNVPEQVNTTFKKVIKIASDLDLNSRAVHTVGPIENSGPIPPKVDQPTTYTIIWSLTNSYNDLSNVRVIGQLPAYVSWEDIYVPQTENIMFDQRTNQVIWDISRLSSGTGFSSSPREVAFRVEMVPSISQVDTNPVIIQQVRVTGNDGFAGVDVSDTAPSVDTTLITDPGVRESEGRVQN